MPSLITQVKSKLFITSARRSMHPLDGAYASLMRGRGSDFEDLREYQVGDQVRDIDWRASARHNEILVKRMRADRMHTVLFVVDTGATMAALAENEEPKYELALLAAGVLGYLTVSHGDDIGLVYGDSEKVKRRASGRTESALESALRTIQTATSQASAAGNINKLLEYVAATISRRMILVIITDEAPITVRTDQLIRRLRVQHDMLWVTVTDANPVLAEKSQAARSDVVTGWGVPEFVHGDATLREAVIAEERREEEERRAMLEKYAISHVTIRDSSEAGGDILRMLDRRDRARS